MNLSLHRLGGEGERRRRERGLLLRDLYCLCGSDDGSALGRRRRGAAFGSCGAGRGGAEGGGLGRVWLISRGRRFSWGCFGCSRLVVVHLEDVLLEVSDPVFLHRQRAMKLHLAEPNAHRGTHEDRKYTQSVQQLQHPLQQKLLHRQTEWNLWNRFVLKVRTDSRGQISEILYVLKRE